MDTEIELKLLVEANDLEALRNWMHKRPQVLKNHQRQLSNNYFDTLDRRLRQLDFGLRVRTIDERSEQTLKTAGKVIGGLHSRPEYNIPIDGRRPDLFLFDRSIWPENTDLNVLQSDLVSQFSTDFTRDTWLLGYNDDDVIEVVLDEGAISAGDNSVPICEVEMELVKGSPSILFDFAMELSQHFKVCPGQASKAARGYRLMDGETSHEILTLETMTLQKEQTVETALIELASGALRHLQSNQDVFFATGDIRALQEVRHGWLWLLQVRHYFEEALGAESLEVLAEAKPWLLKLQWVADALYREQILDQKDQYMKRLDDKKIVRRELKLHDNEQNLGLANALLTSREYSQWMLSLSRWLSCELWRIEGKPQPELDQSVLELARQVLDYSRVYLAERFPANLEQSADDYAAGCERLERALFSGNCFRRLFDPEATTGYRGAWHDMLRGCQELALLQYLQQVAGDLKLKDEEAFERWIQRKRESWVELVEQSKQAALAMEPYWH